MKHGIAFGEHIKTEKIKKRRYVEEGETPLHGRGFLLPGILFITTLLLLFKLFSLQLVQGSDYKKLADSNRTRTQTIHAPRGVIFDRNGTPLVFNTPGFLETVRDKDGALVKTTHLSKEEALAKIAKGNHSVEVTSLREYPYKEATSHVIGYIGQISEQELKTPTFANYPANQWIGKSGIEEQYEQLLRGIDGKQLIEIDALGQKIRSLGQTDPIAGMDIALTLDSKLQTAAYNAAKTIQKGTIIVSKPDGEILAMISRPSFDPNLFTLDNTYKPATDSSYFSLGAVLEDTSNHPLLDRAIAGTYPPGSTFKLITAAAGLDKNIIDGSYTIKDTGVVKIGEFSFANWFYTQYGKTEPGDLDVTRALSRSNDIFFYKLAEKIGVDRLAETAKDYGLGTRLGIDLGGEVPGTVPNKEWKKKVIGEEWYLGDTYHYGIGQGFLLTTPLQVNSWTQVIANGGTLYQPKLLKDSAQKTIRKGIVSEKSVDLIRNGMLQSCAPGGVGFPFFDYKVKNAKLQIDGKDILKVATGSAEMRSIPVACKTGTAQHGGEDTLPHAWITLFAPAYKPEVVVTVLVESSGEGSQVAAPVAKKVLDAYFQEK
jgi:penicillin-binding protein 2